MQLLSVKIMKHSIEAAGNVLVALREQCRVSRTGSQIAESDNEISTATLKALKEDPINDSHVEAEERRSTRDHLNGARWWSLGSRRLGLLALLILAVTTTRTLRLEIPAVL